MEKLYIDENINVSTNFNAENLLKINNDTKYYNSEEQGVHKVSNERCLNSGDCSFDITIRS